MATRQTIIDDAEAILNQNIKGTQRIVFARVVKLLRRFDTTGGKLKFTNAELNLINEVQDEILRALNVAKYDSRVNKYLKDFDRISTETIDEQRKINGLTVRKRPINAIQKSAIQQTTNQLLGNGLDVALIQPVKDVLLASASSGMTIAQAELQLRTTILGNKQRLGHLERYVTQISRDSISQFDGMLQGRIQEELDLDGYSYEGSLIKDSRPQCIKWVGLGELPIKDLPALIQEAFTSGSGMIPGTTAVNFAAFRGGFNCRHFATAIRL